MSLIVAVIIFENELLVVIMAYIGIIIVELLGIVLADNMLYAASKLTTLFVLGSPDS